MRTTSGYDWIWFPTRLAIYARDGWCCLACGRTAGARRLDRLSLDHIDRGGPSHASNLVTLCVSCNSSRGGQAFASWRPDLMPAVRNAVQRKLDRPAARALALELRPGRAAALKARNDRRGRVSPLLVAVPF